MQLNRKNTLEGGRGRRVKRNEWNDVVALEMKAYIDLFADFSKVIMRVFASYGVQLVEEPYSAKQWH